MRAMFAALALALRTPPHAVTGNELPEDCEGDDRQRHRNVSADLVIDSKSRDKNNQKVRGGRPTCDTCATPQGLDLPRFTTLAALS